MMIILENSQFGECYKKKRHNIALLVTIVIEKSMEQKAVFALINYLRIQRHPSLTHSKFK